MTPEDGLKIRPFGKAGLTDQEYGSAPPVAENCVSDRADSRFLPAVNLGRLSMAEMER